MSQKIVPLRTYQMHERVQGARNELTEPHRHGAAVRPFEPGSLSFVLPQRMHMIPHPAGSRYCIINFNQDFLWPELHIDVLDLDGVDFTTQPWCACAADGVRPAAWRAMRATATCLRRR